MPPRHTVVVSDVHLCEVAPEGCTRMPYRQRAHVPDGALVPALDDLAARTRGAPTDLVLGGDLFDFDAPSPADADLPALPPCPTRDEAGAAARMSAILDDHPDVVAALLRAQRAGCRVVFVPGNHDAPLAFPAVRRVLAGRLPGALVRSWFHRTPDGILVEHGHQYDPLCLLERVLPADGRLEDTLGSVAAYYTPAVMGCVDPYALDPYTLRVAELFATTQACAACGPPRLRGHVETVARYLQALAAIPTGAPDARALVAAAAAETGATPAALAAHAALFPAKATVASLAATGGWTGYGPATDGRLRVAAAQISRLHGVRGVVMGHTHRPWGEWVDGVFFGNSGSWTADRPRHPVGAFVHITTDGTDARGGTYIVGGSS